ncbi:MAG: hypothetical protein MJE63_03370 [Proteobacteria bacterium]|nr:hypothetical protein [Pseudomonadota bacterium]
MSYKLKTRKTKPFELYNNLEIGDMVELGFLLKVGEEPRKAAKEIGAEHLWVRIEDVVFESSDIYKAVLTEHPRFLKLIRQGDPVAFSPENVLNAKSKKPHKKIKSVKDFVYSGKNEKYKAYTQVIADRNHTYAIDPGIVILRANETIKESVPKEKLDESIRRDFDELVARFDQEELDKYHVKVDSAFIQKSMQKIKSKSDTKSSQVAGSPLIRIADRTYLSFNLVAKLLVLLKKMLIYLAFHEDFPMLYFVNDDYDGFISLSKRSSDSVIIDVLEK